MNIEQQFKQEIEDMTGVKKQYSRRFRLDHMKKLDAIAKKIGTDQTKVMELAFEKLIKEYEAWKQ